MDETEEGEAPISGISTWSEFLSKEAINREDERTELTHCNRDKTDFLSSIRISRADG